MKPLRIIKNDFNALAFKQKVQAEIYEKIKDMTPEQRISYIHKKARTGVLGAMWRRIEKRQKAKKQKAA